MTVGYRRGYDLGTKGFDAMRKRCLDLCEEIQQLKLSIIEARDGRGTETLANKQCLRHRLRVSSPADVPKPEPKPEPKVICRGCGEDDS